MAARAMGLYATTSRKNERQHSNVTVNFGTIDGCASLYVVGSPGSGKSCAAYAFACSEVDREKWIVVWLHTSTLAPRKCYCVKFDGTQKSTAIVTGGSIAADIMDMVNGLQRPGRGVVVFYDGYVENNKLSRRLRDDLHNWYEENPKERCLVCVSSMVWLDWYKLEVIPLRDPPHSWPPRLFTQTRPSSFRSIMKFAFLSWTLDEYVHAIQNDRFFESVRAKLVEPSTEHAGVVMLGNDQAEPTSLALRSHLIMAKYEVAGGNACLMFVLDTNRAMGFLNSAMQRINTSSDIAENFFGSEGQQVVNWLFAHYYRDMMTQTELVSMYVARKIVERIGAGAIQACKRFLTVNPALDGHLFEGWFFTTIACTGVKCLYHDLDKVKSEWWGPCPTYYFDPASNPFFLSKGWNAPVAWNQAGYDAVYWEVIPARDENPGVRRLLFIQITRAGKSHTYDPNPFLHIVNQLSPSKYRSKTAADRERVESPVDQIDLYFVIPERNLNRFPCPVELVDFKQKVINESKNRFTGEVKCSVRVVGVPYEMQGEAPAVPGPSVVRRFVSVDGIEAAYNSSVDACMPRTSG